MIPEEFKTLGEQLAAQNDRPLAADLGLAGMAFGIAVLIPAVSSAPAGILEASAVSLRTQGFMSAKFDPLADDLLDSQRHLNHHGALYADILPSIRISDEAAFRFRMNVQNTSFSNHRTVDVAWYFSGSMERRFGWDTTAGAPGYWKAEAGNLDDQTIGEGLTFKDFRALGIAGSLAWKGFFAKATSWAQDYDVPGDVFLAELGFKPIRAGANFILWLDEQASKRPSYYALPYFRFPLGPVEIYWEGGLKVPGDEARMKSNPWGYPDRTWAALAGARYRAQWRDWKVGLNPEFRFYGRNFIPLAQAREEEYTSLYNYGKSANNWVDFFSAVERNGWAYLRSTLETPRFRGFSVFLDNELLLFMSSQRLFWDRRRNALISYHPSSDYYHAGARYAPTRGIRVEVLMTNRLLNIDPEVGRDPGNDLALLQYGPAVMRQYQSRFYPSRTPILELRALWGIDAD